MSKSPVLTLSRSLLAGLLLAQLCMLVFPSLALAWESETPVSMPAQVGFVPAGVVVSSSSIDVEEAAITLRYVLNNKNRAQKNNIFSVYLPPYTWQGIAADYPDRHFPELTVSSNFSTPTVHATEIALHNGKDITSEIIRSGLRPTRVGLAEEALLSAERANKRRYKDLIAIGALRSAGNALIPSWYVYTAYSWKQIYDQGSDTQISIKYSARPGFFPIGKNDSKLIAHIHNHCGDALDVQKITSGDQFKDSEELMVKTYLIPFGLGGLNLDRVTLNFSPYKDKKNQESAVSFVCTGSATSEVAKGFPSISAQEIRNQEGLISILVISGR